MVRDISKGRLSTFQKLSLFRNSVFFTPFLFIVLVPATISFVFLYMIAEDQYYSESIFTVIGNRVDDSEYGLAAIGSGKVAPDVAVLKEFVNSRALIDKISSRFDVVKAFSKGDFWFGLPEDAPGDLFMHYWQKMASLTVKPDTGIIRLRTYAFTPQDAQKLSELILEESTKFIDEMNVERERDLLSSAAKRLNTAKSVLSRARMNVREYRMSNRTIDDPTGDLSNVISALELDLSRALIERASLDSQSAADEALIRRIAAIRWQISNVKTDALNALNMRDEMEDLETELIVAQAAYEAALIGKDQARTNASSQNLYLKIHTSPTLPQGSLFPDKLFTLLTVLGCLIAFWAVLVLIIRNIEDRG